MNTALNLIAGGVLIGLALLGRGRWGMIGTPGRVVPAYWLVMGLFPVMILGPQDVPPVGLASVALLCAAFCLGFRVPLARAGRRGRYVVSMSRLAQCVSLLTLGGSMAVPLHLWLVGGSGLLEGDVIRSFAREATLARYVDQVAAPAPVRLASVLFYAAAGLGGVLYSYSKRSRDLWALLPGVAYGALTTTKATILWSALLWMGGLMAGLRSQRSATHSINFRVLAIAVGGGVAALLATFVLRYGLKDANQLVEQGARLRIYALAHMWNYSIWLSDTWAEQFSDLALGAQSFRGMLSTIGLADRAYGAYDDFVGTHEAMGNIFTAFRGLIEDFSLPGAGLLLILGGASSRFLFEDLARLGPKPLSLVGLQAFYLCLGWSFTLNPLYYTTLVLALGLTWAVLAWSCDWTDQPNSSSDVT